MSGAVLELLVSPSTGSVQAHVRGEMLVQVLSLRMRRQVVLTVAPNYDEMQKRLANGSFDVAWAPPTIRSAAAEHTWACFEPWRRGQTGYHAALVALASRQLTPKKLRGLRAAWVDPASAGGYRLAQAHLTALGLPPDDLFSSQTFYGNYKAALQAVLSGAADVTSLYSSHCNEQALRTSLAEHVGTRESELGLVLFTTERAGDAVLVSRRLPTTVAHAVAAELVALGSGASGSGTLLDLLKADALELVTPLRLTGAARVPMVPAHATAEVDASGTCVRLWCGGSFFGHRENEVVGRKLIESIPVEGIACVAELIEQVDEEKSPQTVDFRTSLDDLPRWVSAQLQKSPTATSMLVSFRDVTENKQTEGILVQLASFSIFDPNPLLEVEPAGVVVWANPAARHLLNATANGPSLLVTMAVKAALAEPLLSTVHVDISLTERDFHLTVSRIPDSTNLRVFGHDISARKRMEALLARAERLSALGNLAAGVGHEINNPLAYVLSNLSFAIDELNGDRPEVSAALLEAKGGAEKVCTIVRDLKQLSRADEQTVAALNLQKVAESSLAMLANEIQHRGTLIRDYQATPSVRGNESRLGQVVLNLLQNALHALEEVRGGLQEITVGTSTDAAGNAVLWVQDTGPGIAPAALARIFEPFFTTKGVGKGTGLGLSMSETIVSRMGGRILVKSELGRGTTFEVVLPPNLDGVVVAPARLQPATTPFAGRLLVIDDDVHVGRGLKRMLRGFEVTCVHSGLSGAELVEAEGEKFALVLCDLMMPGMSGADVYARLLKSRPDQAKKLVFISGGAFTNKIEEFLASIDNVLLEKPFTRDDVLGLLKKPL